MKSNKKLKLDDFKVQSFVTSDDNKFGSLNAASIGEHPTHTVKSKDTQHNCCSNTTWNGCSALAVI